MFVRDWLIEAHAPAWIETAVLIKTVATVAASLWSSFHKVLGLWLVGLGSQGFSESTKSLNIEKVEG